MTNPAVQATPENLPGLRPLYDEATQQLANYFDVHGDQAYMALPYGLRNLWVGLLTLAEDIETASSSTDPRAHNSVRYLLQLLTERESIDETARNGQ